MGVANGEVIDRFTDTNFPYAPPPNYLMTHTTQQKVTFFSFEQSVCTSVDNIMTRSCFMRQSRFTLEMYEQEHCRKYAPSKH